MILDALLCTRASSLSEYYARQWAPWMLPQSRFSEPRMFGSRKRLPLGCDIFCLLFSHLRLTAYRQFTHWAHQSLGIESSKDSYSILCGVCCMKSICGG